QLGGLLELGYEHGIAHDVGGAPGPPGAIRADGGHHVAGMGDADQLVDVAPDHRHPGEAPREHDVEHGIEVGVGVDAHHVGPGHHHRPDHRVAELEDRADHLALLRLDDLLGLGHLEH